MINKNKRPYDPATLAPRPKLRRNIVDLAANNAIPAARLAEVCRDVNAVDPASFADIARIRPSNKNEARNLNTMFCKNIGLAKYFDRENGPVNDWVHPVRQPTALHSRG